MKTFSDYSDSHGPTSTRESNMVAPMAHASGDSDQFGTPPGFTSPGGLGGPGDPPRTPRTPRTPGNPGGGHPTTPAEDEISRRGGPDSQPSGENSYPTTVGP